MQKKKKKVEGQNLWMGSKMVGQSWFLGPDSIISKPSII